MDKKICVLFLLIIMFACQPNPVVKDSASIMPTINPRGTTVYDYFDKNISVKSVNIFPIPYENIKNININIGDVKRFSARVYYSDLIDDKSVDWFVSDNNIASISKNGELIGLNEGTVIVTGKSRYKPEKSENITVNIFKPIEIIGLNPIPSISNDKNGKIAFTYQGGNLSTGKSSSIFIINPDGSNLIKDVTSSYCTFPQWSPDGSKILFQYNRSGPSLVIKDNNDEIFIVNKDGSNLIRLSGNTGFDGSPHWSQDSSKIVFLSNRDRSDEKSTDTKNYEIYSMNSDGSDQKRLTSNNNYDSEPKWSPDGTKIAFISKKNEQFEMYLMNSDGSREKQLTNNIGFYNDIQWSPDGTKIAFVSKKDEQYRINLINIDGSNLIQLTSKNDYWPRWSPDGTKILFTSLREDNRTNSIYLMNTDGTNQIKLGSHYDYNPQWSPDGSMITFSSWRYEINKNSERRVYIMNADGSNEHPLNPQFDDSMEEQFSVWGK